MEKRLMMFLVGLFLSVGMALAQTQVSGTVVSGEDGEPIIGASIKVLGTNTGTVTDTDGKFSLSTPAGSRLEISYIGMQSKTVKAGPNMKVTLEGDNKTLDEVMVVAYGTQKKSAFTGSAATVKSDDISKVQVASPVEALKGKVSGVQMQQSSGQPGQTSSIRIRGISSISSGQSPLYVVDGSPFDGDLNTINPQDIADITVLKDAASAALYGSRGANGVILITTKVGRTNHATVTVDAKWGVNSRALRNYDYINSPAGYYETWYKGLYNYARDKQNMTDLQAFQFANGHLTDSSDYGLGYNVYTIPTGDMLIGSNGKLNPRATLGNVVTYKGENYLLRPDNWINATYRNALRQEYTVSATGSTDKSTFYASANYLNMKGITAGSSMKRFTSRLKADYQVKPWMKIAVNMNYAHYDNNQVSDDGNAGYSGNLFTLLQLAPIYPLYMRDGDGKILIDSRNGLQRLDYGDGGFAGLTRPILAQANPLSDIYANTNNVNGNTFNGVGTVEIRFLKDFKFTSTNSVYLDEDRDIFVRNPWYGQFASSKGISNLQHNRRWSYNYQQLLNWHRTFGLHEIDAMLGHEYYRTRGYALVGSKNNMFSNSYTELSGAVTMQNVNSSRSDYNTEGYFGRVNYSYADKYFGELSYRRDASSTFDPKYRWGNFWSLGGAWIISKEKWFNAKFVDELKFKLSYGSQGNDGIGSYRYVDTYTITPSGSSVALLPGTLGNQNVSWEKQGMFNTGFDFSLFRQRLSGSFVFFYRTTKDMLAWVSLPPSYGWTGFYSNIGDMRNAGIEVELNGDIIRTKDFVWSAKFNLSSYSNRITRLADKNKSRVVEGYKGYTSGDKFYAENLSMYTYLLPKYAGVDANTGEALYYKDTYEMTAAGTPKLDDNGQPVVSGRTTVKNPSEATEYLCGTALPDAYGGFGTSFTWKGFDFSVDFAYQLGGQVFDGNYQSMMYLNRGGNLHKDILGAWSATNKNSSIPRLQYNDQYTASSSDRWLTSASYLSLQNVSFGYTLPRQVVSKIGVANVRFYVVGDNLALFAKRRGLDPRQSVTGAVSTEYYSPIRTVSGGLTVTF